MTGLQQKALTVSRRWRLATVLMASTVLVSDLAACTSYKPLPLSETAQLAPDVSQLRGVSPLQGGAAQQPLSVAAVGLLALQNNPDLKAVRLQHGLAQAQLLQAGLPPNPVVTGAILPLLAGPAYTWAWNAGISMDITSLITLSARRRGAAAAARQVDAQILWQEWQTVGQARLLAVDVMEGERTLVLLRRQRDLLAHRAEQSRRAVESGNATITVLAPDVAALQSARVQLDDAEQQQFARRHKLNALLGLRPEAPLPLMQQPDVPTIDRAAVLKALPALPERRPDLIALRLGYQAQDAKVRAAILAQFPPLTFGVIGGSDNTNIRNIGPQPTVELPIFNRNQGNVAIEQATRQQLHAEYAARLDQADGEVRAMLVEIAQIRRQLAAAQAERAATAQIARQASAAFAAGNLDERGYVDLINTHLGKEQQIVALEQAMLDKQVAIDTLTGAGMPLVALQEARS